MQQIILPNGHQLKIVATDMDGTLLKRNQTIETRTADMLRALQQQGVRVVLVSGRPLGGMLKYGRELDLDTHDGVIIGANGGEAYSYRVEANLWRHTLPLDMAQHYFQLWKPFGMRMFAYGARSIYMDLPAETPPGAPLPEVLMERWSKVTGMEIKVRDLTKPLPERPTKACVAGPHEEILAAHDKVKHEYEASLYGAFSAPTYYEAMMRGINKGTGLQEYADFYGIRPEEIVAFGDEDNDIPMLAYAGTGVAMEVASDGLVKVASHRTISNEDGGIYEFLSQLERREVAE